MEANEYWSAKAFAEYEGYLQQKQMKDYELLCAQVSPSVLRKPRVFKDGNQWCCLLGDSLQEGVCGFGDTPEKACADFDMNWYKG